MTFRRGGLALRLPCFARLIIFLEKAQRNCILLPFAAADIFSRKGAETCLPWRTGRKEITVRWANEFSRTLTFIVKTKKNGCF
jgi:hypothetical protein